MKHIFIDANIFLNFFEMSDASVQELELLVTLIQNKEAKLWITEQVKREFWKNREGNIYKQITGFENYKTLGPAPLLLKEKSNFRELQRLADDLDIKKTNLANSLKDELRKESTHADKIIKELLQLAESIDTDEKEIFEKAWKRALASTPPGKNNDIGDRLNWVALLEKVPQNSDLHLITADNDFASKHSGDIKTYLRFEWEKKNQGTLTLWHRISKFIVHQFPNAENAKDLERDIYIKRLQNSNLFAITHEVIAELNKLSGFNAKQVKEICSAIMTNDQIYRIMCDSDVKLFAEGLIENYESDLTEEDIESLKRCIKNNA